MVTLLDKNDSRIQEHEAKNFHKLIETSRWNFSIVPDVFKQSLPDTDDLQFDYLKENFGLIGDWDQLKNKIDKLNQDSDDGVYYKVFFLARHGQGYHNLAHEKYGEEDWNEYWSKLTGDGEIVWGPDPELTNLGINQAKSNNIEWKNQINLRKAPIPTKFYVSPLSRSIDTLIYTWDDLVDLKKLQPIIKENIRETTGVHTCDKRSPKSVIADKYAKLGFVFEDNFVEEDIYYKPEERETVEQHALRVFESFQQIFSENKNSNPFISITSHSGTIRASLLALGHREFTIGTGGMIPVCVRAIEKTPVN